MSSHVSTHLLIIIVALVVDHVEEAELVDALAGADNAKPVTELLFLEEFLRPMVHDCQSLWPISERGLPSNIQVLQVSSGEWNVGDDFDLTISDLGDADTVSKVAGAAFDFDAVVEELLES